MNSRHAIRVMIFILCALASSTVYGANSCQSLFRIPGTPLIDSRYGRAGQDSDQLRKAGVVDPGGSNLCGPTCMVNALHKFHVVADSLAKKHMTDDQRIADLAKRVFPNLGIDVVRKAAPLVEVAQALRIALREDGLLATVATYSVSTSEEGAPTSLNEKELLSSVDDNKVILVAFGYYSQVNPVRAAHWNRKTGHFMLLVGHNTTTREFYFVDPMYPRQLRVATMTRIQPDAFIGESLQVKFIGDPVMTRTILVDGMLVATLKPK